MDQRQVFSNNQELLSILENLYTHKQKVFLLLDDKGLSRCEGAIISIKRMGNPENALIIMEGEQPIELKRVIAVNGVFRSDYSEC